MSLVVLLILIIPSSLSSLTKSCNRVSEFSASQYAHCSNNSECPTWFVCNSSNYCQCGNDYNYAVTCDNKHLTSAVLDCYCVSYDTQSRYTYLGSCFYNCDHQSVSRSMYESLPANPQMLINGSVCAYFNRAGLLCGDCKEGHSPFVLSYNLSCVECPDGHKNWWKFILAGFVPLTLFYFFVVLFNINVTSSRLHGVIWFSQALSMPVLVRSVLFVLSREYPKLLNTAKIILIFYSFWNLDFLRSIIPDICLNVSTLQALALDYLVAVYPLLLILFSHIVIKLYDSKVSVIAMAWRPFQALLAVFQESINVRTSIIDSFASFFLLSYTKILSVTSDLLIPTQIHQLGSNVSTFGLYYSPTVVYFGEEHLPYAILAISMLVLFVCVPTIILLLYPFQFFQKILSLFPFNRHYLSAFVDSFQGCYKDGTEPGTFDCRWLSVMPLLLRLVLLIISALTLSYMYLVYAAITLVTFLIVMINIRPYNEAATRYPSNDPIFLILLSVCYVANIGRDVESRENIFYNSTIIMTILALLSAVVPILYIGFFISFWLVMRIKWIHKLVNRQRHRQ